MAQRNRKAEQMAGEQETQPLRAVKSENGEAESPVRVAAPRSIRGLQERTLQERDLNDEVFPTQLVVVGGDNIVIYHVDLPLSVLVALLDPAVPDGFIKVNVQSTSRSLPVPNGKYRFLHTSQIREVVIDKDFPEDALRGEL